MRKILVPALLLVGLFALAATASAAANGKAAGNKSAPQSNGNNRNFTTHLIGANETPPVDTQAHGEAIFHVSKDGLSVDFQVIASQIISVTAGHIHSGTVGLAGPVVVPLVSATACTTVNEHMMCQGTFTAADLVGPLAGHPLSDLLDIMESGHAYVNLHNTDHPAGVIRGQLGLHGGGNAAARSVHARIHAGHHRNKP